MLLLTAIAGYWVLERASAHRGRLKQVGQWLGGLVIVLSLLGLVCRFWCLFGGGTCPAMSGKMWKGGMGSTCPFTPKAPTRGIPAPDSLR